jgi:phosphoglycolate phosphatase
MQFTHAIFDLDGTLVDSAPEIIGALRVTFQVHGLVGFSTADCMAGIHLPLAGLIRLLAPECPEQHDTIAATFRTVYDGQPLAGTIPYPGVPAGLIELGQAGIDCSILTNKRRLPTLRILRQQGWESLFSDVATSCDLPPGTGKAAAIRHVVSRRRLDPARCLYIGDAEADWRACRESDVLVAWVPWGYGSPRPGAPGVWCVPTSFPDLVGRLLADERGLP